MSSYDFLKKIFFFFGVTDLNGCWYISTDRTTYTEYTEYVSTISLSSNNHCGVPCLISSAQVQSPANLHWVHSPTLFPELSCVSWISKHDLCVLRKKTPSTIYIANRKNTKYKWVFLLKNLSRLFNIRANATGNERIFWWNKLNWDETDWTRRFDSQELLCRTLQARAFEVAGWLAGWLADGSAPHWLI